MLLKKNLTKDEQEEKKIETEYEQELIKDFGITKVEDGETGGEKTEEEKEEKKAEKGEKAAAGGEKSDESAKEKKHDKDTSVEDRGFVLDRVVITGSEEEKGQKSIDVTVSVTAPSFANGAEDALMAPVDGVAEATGGAAAGGAAAAADTPGKRDADADTPGKQDTDADMPPAPAQQSASAGDPQAPHELVQAATAAAPPLAAGAEELPLQTRVENFMSAVEREKKGAKGPANKSLCGDENASGGRDRKSRFAKTDLQFKVGHFLKGEVFGHAFWEVDPNGRLPDEDVATLIMADETALE